MEYWTNGKIKWWTFLLPLSIVKKSKVMKLTMFLIVLSILQVRAAGLGQDITLSVEEASLQEVFKEIRKQSGYDFIYTTDLIRLSKPISVNVSDMPLKEVLEICFVNQPITYLVEEKAIVLRKKVFVDVVNYLDKKNFNKLIPAVPADTTKGRVIDESGVPLIGVNIQVKGTNKGTTTDFDGEFELLDVEEGSILVLSYIGYTTTEVEVGSSSTTLEIEMNSDAETLDELVVVGYGTQLKSDLTGSVGTLKGEELQERPVSSLNQGLSGRIAGVDVSTNSGRPGGRANIRIRGASSISVSNDPLYVIDGVILNSVDLENGSSPIDYLNPNDIESIEVLKDASSTAIYGARGANGVILVTTKRGSSGGGRVTYDSDFSVGVAPRHLPVLNAEEFLRVEEIIYENAEKYDPVGWATGTKYTDPRTKRTNPLLFDDQGNPLYDTDWQDAAFQEAFTQNHQLGFTNGNETGNYGVFLNYRNENGIVYGSWQKRYSGRFTFDSNINSWLKIGGSLGYTDQNDKQVDQLGGGGITMMRQALEALPIIPVRYEDGSWASNRDYPGMEGGDNPIRVADERLYYLRTQTMLGNVFANIRLTDDLQFRSMIGSNIINQRTDYFAAAGLQYISNNGDASVTNNRFNSWQFENYLTYNKDITADQSLNAMLGLSWQHIDRFNNQARSQGFADTYFEYNNLGAGTTALTPSSVSTAYGLNSYFTRLNYSLQDKYLVTFTGRLDGSSKFGEENQYAFFPSAAFAWRAIDEEFMKQQTAISNLKFRASYGVTGNSEIPAYRALAGMNNYDVIFGGSREVGIGIGRIPNPALQWEKTHQIDIGMELGLFSSRLNFELDVYRRKVNDMLLDTPLPLSSGYGSIFSNIGSMENKGVEFAVNSVNVTKNDFSWSTTFNISINKNQVLELSGGSDIYSGATVIRVGEPVGSFFGRVHQGIWSTNEAEEAKEYGLLPGDVKYLDLNEDGEINDLDRAIIGKGIPDGFGTLLNTFEYGNWSLTVDLQFMYGNDVLDRSIHSAEDRQGIANSYKTVLNAWTEDNQNTPIAQIRPINAYYTTNNDSHKVTDASFLRGRNLLLSYVFPHDIYSKMKLSKLRVYASVQNFFVATKYTGYDPEVSNSGAAFNQGFGLYDYPRPRVFMIGINAGL
ncbi:TonB-dependent receptor [Membranihabitans maritimus]|uniref:TonB-dependent receptor n=1 Tax=Membranihabitans maritimus TaxID=2904244 RepID=UPI001F2159EE|nr:TonB-dependent receptor [Membranihabitans maritimus]